MREGIFSFKTPTDRLSPRQKQIFGLYAQGSKPACIQISLEGSPKKTIGSHIEQGKKKYDLNTIVSAVIHAFEVEELNIDDFVSDAELVGFTSRFTDPELEIFKLTYEYRNYVKPNSKIANKLTISPDNLNRHFAQINEKLGTTSQLRALVLYHAALLRGEVS